MTFELIILLFVVPSKIPRPGVGFQNNSCSIIYWESPVPRRGNTEIYEVNFRSRLEDGDEETVIINTTSKFCFLVLCYLVLIIKKF